MATSHEFLALSDDFESVLAWLGGHGAVKVGQHPERGTLVLHFPEFGPLTTWASNAAAAYPENSREWRAAALATITAEREPDVPYVNQLVSATAGVEPPTRGPRGFWWSASVWFPTPRLREAFPGLARVNGQFQRLIRKNLLVFDNTGREQYVRFGDRLGGFEGIIRKVYALPSAAAQLKAGGPFVAQGTSAKILSEFLRRRELAGKPVA